MIKERENIKGDDKMIMLYMIELSPNEKKVLLALKAGKYFPTDIVEETGLEMVAVMSAASWLKSKGLVKINEKINVFYALDKDGKTFGCRGVAKGSE